MLLANSPFNGAWLMDIQSVLATADPDIFLIENSVFTRGKGDDPVTAKIDGRFHRVRDGREPYELAVTVLDRRRVRTVDRDNGKIIYRINYAVAADGRTLTSETIAYNRPDGRPVRTIATFRRIGQPPRTGALLSGRWQPIRMTRGKKYLTEVLRIERDHFSSVRGGGLRYEATIGGPSVKLPGDGGEVAVKMPSPRVVVLDWSDGGTPTFSLTMTLLANNRTIEARGRRADGTSTYWLMRKQ